MNDTDFLIANYGSMIALTPMSAERKQSLRCRGY